MEITEIKDRWVKIGKTSITVKDDETGKTCGVVRDVTRFTDLQANRKFDYSKVLRSSGIWGSGKAENCLVVDGKLYFVFNTNGMEMQKEHFPDEYAKKKELIDKVKASEIEFIPVRF